MPSNKYTPLYIRTTPDVKDMAVQRAAEENRSLTSYIEQLIKADYNKNK